MTLLKCSRVPLYLMRNVDIWSLGVVMYQVLYKANPCKIMGKNYVFYNVQTGRCDLLDDLILECLQVDPKKRLSLQGLRDHDFLKMDVNSIKNASRDWCGLIERDTTLSAKRVFSDIDMSPHFLSG